MDIISNAQDSTPEDVIMKFQGFTPTPEAQHHCNEVLNQLHDEAPSCSVLKAKFIQGSQALKGAVKISSTVGSFFAVAEAPELFEVVQKLSGSIRDQLEKWKAHRVVVGALDIKDKDMDIVEVDVDFLGKEA